MVPGWYNPEWYNHPYEGFHDRIYHLNRANIPFVFESETNHYHTESEECSDENNGEQFDFIDFIILKQNSKFMYQWTTL